MYPKSVANSPIPTMIDDDSPKTPKKTTASYHISMLLLIHLPTILDKRLLMHKPHKPPLSQNTNVPQPQFDKTLVHQIHGRADLQRHGRRVDVRREIRRVGSQGSFGLLVAPERFDVRCSCRCGRRLFAGVVVGIVVVVAETEGVFATSPSSASATPFTLVLASLVFVFG